MLPLVQRLDYRRVSAAITRPTVGDCLRLWDHAAPHAKGDTAADVPAMIAFIPDHLPANCPTVVVCPGGGYWKLSEQEANPVAEWLNSIGIAAFVLRSRLAPNYRHPAMLTDLRRAIRSVRAMAGSWKLDPQRIGVIGFSAGGHLASTALTHFVVGDPAQEDPVERVSSRPDIGILIYPVISLIGPECAHESCESLLGPQAPRNLLEELSSHLQVTSQTPPCFLVHSRDDDNVPLNNSRFMADALSRCNVPNELLVLDHGGHGYGLGANAPQLCRWPEACARWLRKQQFCH